MSSIQHNPIDAIKHNNEKRVMIPTSELAGEEKECTIKHSGKAAYQTFRHEFDRGRDPELYWLGKYRNDDSAELPIDIRSLYVHEDIQPEMLIQRLYRLRVERADNAPAAFFSEEEMGNIVEDELERVCEYYKHPMGWKNRLIQGDSLLVMNSLLQLEGMAGKVQCVYIDPPYGIRFGSNWQMKLNDRNVKDNDESVSGEPEMIKAFRDTWELGIHSYLSYLRDRLVTARELLTQSGSCFVQISDENVHLVRNLMDEVFGSENFVSMIVYQKTTGAGSPGELKTIPSVVDYILWFAKDKSEVKYRKLYREQIFGKDGTDAYSNIELANGERMTIKQYERNRSIDFNYQQREKGSKVYRLSDIRSSSSSISAQFPIVFNGKTYTIRTGSWKTHQKGIERLISLNRIVSLDNTLAYVRYLEDFPYMTITNIWNDVSSSLGGKKLYVVQSNIKPIQRCILMTTDPGDLVLDPTCGSGTTAYVAEQWGRRWITIDTSRIALNIAKKRLTSALFPYYELFDEQTKNIRQGFKYKTVPHITLKSLANNLPPAEEILYDQPKEDKKRMRVSGPFTVETLQSYNVQSPESMSLTADEEEENRLFQERIFAHLQSSGVRNGDKTQQAIFHGMEPVPNPYLNARGYYKDKDGRERLAYFMIGPKFGTVSKAAVNKAVREFRDLSEEEGAKWLVLLGFSFEDNINEKHYDFGNFTVSKVRMHDDLMQDGLLKKDRGAGSFITIGEPDIAIVREDDDASFCHIEIRGLDIYDPIKDDVKARSVEDIAYWEMDDLYDGRQFIVRSIHFCGGDKKEFAAWKKGLESLAKSSAKTKKQAQDTLRLELSDELWDTLYTFRSEKMRFEPGRKVAVRVVSQFGEESSKVLTMK
jgi:adenine-specific DNA-methyltransferase